MSRSAFWISLPLFVTMLSAPAFAQGKQLLFFGNSFTINNNVAGKVGQLAVADGYSAPNIVTDLLGGQNVAYHNGQIVSFPGNNVAAPSIAGDTWDHVILQGFSTETTHIGNPSAFVNNSVTFSNLIRGHANGQGAQIVLYQTWARAIGHSYYPGTFANPNSMQAEIRASYESALLAIDANAGASVAKIAPVGDAFQALGFVPSMYDADLYHANVTGSLLSSMVLYRTIYGEDVSDISYATVSSWAGVNESTWNTLATTADNTAIVPEPSSVMLGLLGVAALIAFRLRTIRNRNRLSPCPAHQK